MGRCPVRQPLERSPNCEHVPEREAACHLGLGRAAVREDGQKADLSVLAKVTGHGRDMSDRTNPENKFLGRILQGSVRLYTVGPG